MTRNIFTKTKRSVLPVLAGAAVVALGGLTSDAWGGDSGTDASLPPCTDTDLNKMYNSTSGCSRAAMIISFKPGIKNKATITDTDVMGIRMMFPSDTGTRFCSIKESDKRIAWDVCNDPISNPCIPQNCIGEDTASEALGGGPVRVTHKPSASADAQPGSKDAVISFTIHPTNAESCTIGDMQKLANFINKYVKGADGGLLMVSVSEAKWKAIESTVESLATSIKNSKSNEASKKTIEQAKALEAAYALEKNDIKGVLLRAPNVTKAELDALKPTSCYVTASVISPVATAVVNIKNDNNTKTPVIQLPSKVFEVYNKAFQLRGIN